MSNRIKLEEDFGSEYEPTDSGDEYSVEEKEILRELRERKQKKGDKKLAVMPFAETDDDDEEEDNEGGDHDSDDLDDLMDDSDIEGKADDDQDDIPDARDWGSKSKNYYNTDFVDPDYNGYTAEDAELAKQEEEEARVIQQRLAKQMKEEDFFDDFMHKSGAKSATPQVDVDATKLKADFSGLSKREKQQLFQKDSPEFSALTTDFMTLMKDVEVLHTPILNYVATHDVPLIPALQFTKVYRNIALTYCSNIGFYLLLKAKRVGVRNHPITKRLAQTKKLLMQLQDKYDNIIKPQLEALSERIIDGDEFDILETKSVISRKTSKKYKLSILDQYNEDENVKVDGTKNLETDPSDILRSSDEECDEENSQGDDHEYVDDAEGNEDNRRSITYEIAKNKGLTPHRKKENRNPRVKHRNKFRKALIRRKGAVRTVRKEVKRYGGEISGIKSTVVKSVKFKV